MALPLFPLAAYATADTPAAAAPIGPGMNEATSPTFATTPSTLPQAIVPPRSVQLTGSALQ